MEKETKNCVYADCANLPRLNIPVCDARIRPSDTTRALDIYDPIRSKWVALTPEEWVRRNFVDFLINHRGFKATSIANEVSLTLNKTRRRADTVIYDHFLRPKVIVEYKAADIPLTREVVEQALRYNIVLGAPYVVITNGMDVYTVHCAADGAHIILRGIPTADELR